eukprot:scaffold24660_cov147-Cylindrotheca_fusiformis.AAC.2
MSFSLTHRVLLGCCSMHSYRSQYVVTTRHRICHVTRFALTAIDFVDSIGSDPSDIAKSQLPVLCCCCLR